MKGFFIISCLILGTTCAAQVFTEDFESGSGGYSSSIVECTDNGGDYFILTNGGNVGGTYNGASGSYFAAADIDAATCPVAPGATATLTWTGISITGCTGLSLSVDAAEDDDGGNQDWDGPDFVHIEVSIDAGAYVPVIWFESLLAGTNGEPAQDVAFDGLGDAGLEVTSTFQTFTGAIAGTGTTMDIRITFTLDSGDEDIALDNLTLTAASCGPCPGPGTEPTDPVSGVSVPSLGCTGAEIEWTIGSDADNVIVVLSSTAPISANPTDGVDYSVGDALGGGTVIYQGSGSNVTITGLTPGVTYYYSIFEYTGNTPDCDENYFNAGTAIGSFTTVDPCSTTPQINSINYNSCNGTSEGTDELIVFTTGDDAIPIDSIELDLPNTMFCNSCTPSDGALVNNAAFITALNTMAGCTMFEYCDPIPPNSVVMVFTGNPPTTVLDYSSNCGSPDAPFCCFFMDNSSTVGNFANYSSTPRVLTINFGSGVSTTVSYTGTDGVCNCDGATVNFDANGNATYVQNTDCIYPLDAKIKTLSGYGKEYSNVIEWSTYNDYSSEVFKVLRSTDGENWNEIDQVYADRSLWISSFYEIEDFNIEEGLEYYYKLEIIDTDGLKSPSNSIFIQRNSISTYYVNNMISIGFNAHPAKTYTLNIYDLSGALILQTNATNGMQVPWNRKGFFILEIPELGIRRKLITQ